MFAAFEGSNSKSPDYILFRALLGDFEIQSLKIFGSGNLTGKPLHLCIRFLVFEFIKIQLNEPLTRNH